MASAFGNQSKGITVPASIGTATSSFFSILGERVPLRFDRLDAREQFGFVPVEVLVTTPFHNNSGIAGRTHYLGIWSIAKTNLGLMYVTSVDGKLYKILVSQARGEPTCITAYDEAASITVFDGHRAIAQAVRFRNGDTIFRNNCGGEVKLEHGEGNKVTPQLMRLFSPEVLMLFDQNLHTGLGRLVARDNDPVPGLIPVAIVLCCIKAEIHYDSDGGWGGSVGFDCTCLN